MVKGGGRSPPREMIFFFSGDRDLRCLFSFLFLATGKIVVTLFPFGWRVDLKMDPFF